MTRPWILAFLGFGLGLGLALAFLLSTPVLAQEAPTRQQAREAVKTCRADIQTLCPDARAGGGRILACLEDNADAVSEACAQSMDTLRALRDERMGGQAAQ